MFQWMRGLYKLKHLHFLLLPLFLFFKFGVCDLPWQLQNLRCKWQVFDLFERSVFRLNIRTVLLMQRFQYRELPQQLSSVLQLRLCVGRTVLHGLSVQRGDLWLQFECDNLFVWVLLKSSCPQLLIWMWTACFKLFKLQPNQSVR